MDWKIFFATFSAIFVAEMADKTQLIGITMSSKSGKPLVVFLGSLCGYAIATLISVAIGATLGNFIKPDIIRYVGAFLFIVVGVLMFLGWM